METRLKRLDTGTFIKVNDKTYRLYMVRLIWPDGKSKDFQSEEHANAFLERRAPNFVAFETP